MSPAPRLYIAIRGRRQLDVWCRLVAIFRNLRRTFVLLGLCQGPLYFLQGVCPHVFNWFNASSSTTTFIGFHFVCAPLGQINIVWLHKHYSELHLWRKLGRLIVITTFDVLWENYGALYPYFHLVGFFTCDKKYFSCPVSTTFFLRVYSDRAPFLGFDQD